MKTFLLLISLLLCYCSVNSQSNYSKELIQKSINEGVIIPENFKTKIVKTPDRINTVLNKSNQLQSQALVYDTTKWATMVDEAWGSGPSTAEMLKMFDKYWDTININYSCFVGLKQIDWDSLAKNIRDEIAGGVSKGRFAGLMQSLVAKLNDGHTGFYDFDIANSDLYQGLPAVLRSSQNLFPATLTAMPDSTAMVLYANKNNVFGLEPGDKILGYNHQKLLFLCEQVLRHKLPNYLIFGSSEAATKHNLIIGMACAWNLFDTIDIEKNNGSVVHFPTKLMENTYYWSNGYEILPIKGIAFPSIQLVYNGKIVTSGILEGTDIGYLSMLACVDQSNGDTLLRHLKRLVEVYKVRGIIFDIRKNIGGGIGSFAKGMDYLYNGNLINWFSLAERDDPKNRLSTGERPPYRQWYNFYNEDPSEFTGPIALLTGPNAISAGDILPVYFKNIPNLKSFGLKTATAFGGNQSIAIGGPDNYFGSYQYGNFYQTKKPVQFLTHNGIPVDNEVWFTRESVSQGKDDVLEAAKSWINYVTDVKDYNNSNCINIYPNPADEYINVTITDGNTESFTLLNTQGKELMTGTTGSILPMNELNTGIYFVRCGTQISKFMVIR